MKRIYACGLGIAVALGTTGLGYAADLPVKTAAPPPFVAPVYNWTGFYIGGNLGGAWASVDLTGNFAGARWSSDDGRFIIGGQLGYNYQIGQFVLGVEWDFDWADGDKTSGFRPTVLGPMQATIDSNWVMTLAARFGYAADRWLFYTKLGGGWTQIDASLRAPGGGVFASGSRTNSGWLVGAGIEYAFAQNWTGKIEYNYLGLSDFSYAAVIAPARVSVSPDLQMLKFGINYKF